MTSPTSLYHDTMRQLNKAFAKATSITVLNMAYHQYPSFVLPLLLITLASMSSNTLVAEARHLLELTLPELPTLPHLPTLPEPELPSLPKVELPTLPHFPSLPEPKLPAVPELEVPKLPELPKPTLPTIAAIPKTTNTP
ncbi:hypothetical protein F0562_020892 [Nyssa sinensis]|uniref:Uncharacterized protein n=1 Tax=Nyssa sinensis TaxID=561372 RepID=A0A5J5BV60_9ASTE|nr:hypothetical protein F0562_020892 [Nyssa sinensis]